MLEVPAALDVDDLDVCLTRSITAPATGMLPGVRCVDSGGRRRQETLRWEQWSFRRDIGVGRARRGSRVRIFHQRVALQFSDE